MGEGGFGPPKSKTTDLQSALSLIIYYSPALYNFIKSRDLSRDFVCSEPFSGICPILPKSAFSNKVLEDVLEKSYNDV